MNLTWSMPKERLVGLVAMSLGCVLALAGIAWSCTAQPRIINLIPVSAPPGQQVSVSGQGVSPEMAPQDVGTGKASTVEIRWNGLHGPSLASVEVDPQGNFSTKVTVPQAPPGVYTLIVAAGESGIARASLEVVAPAGPPVTAGADAPAGRSAGLWEGFRPQASAGVADRDQTMNDPGPILAAGVGMVAAGAAVLAAGAVAALARRRPRRS